MRPALLVLAVLTLTGCQGLAEGFGLSSGAQAPAYQGVGVLIVGSENEARLASRTDQSGDTAAKGEGSQTADMTQEIPAEAVEALIEAAKATLAAGNPAAAASILGAIPTAKKKPAPAPAPVPAPVEPAPAPGK